ncbi:MAG: hypothetical protein ACT4P6_21570 [Gemmatimonadaceae bacterium]
MEDRRIEGNFSQGWGIAGLIVLLAVVAFVTAGLIKQNTFRPPTDPLGPAPAAEAKH